MRACPSGISGSGVSWRYAPWLAGLDFLLRGLKSGELVVRLPDGSRRLFSGSSPGPRAEIEVIDPAVARRIVTGGSIALAEGYMDGCWDTPDIDGLLDLAALNLQGGSPRRPAALSRPLQRLRHARRDNDLAGARRNIEHHYDLGNDFYRLWLDPTMTYSAACFEGDPVLDLEQAQRRKWDRVLELIQPGSGDHLLEIGCGWGGFAVHAAREAGCRVTGLTLSSEQAALARRCVEENGLEGRVEIRLRDYREEKGVYEKIASIEMFEAVGERWWPAFFGKIRDLLRPGGRAGLQVITIADEHFKRYRRQPDFIQRYIFPGGMLPSPERFNRVAAGAGLNMGRPRFFGEDYARTLAIWASRFERVLPEVRALGFDERFIRMWRYYLAYCRAGFTSGRIDVMQVALEP